VRLFTLPGRGNDRRPKDGLIGEHHVDVLAICGGKEPAQMQSQQTFVDGLLTLVTLTIYAPVTTKVWCNKA
jgi:hypothetical protein